MQTEPKCKEAYVNGIRMTYWDWESSGPTILLMHDLYEFGRIWDWVARELHPDFRVVAPDLRGHGDTDKPVGRYAVEQHVADIEDLIRHLGLDWVILGGYSFGSRVGLIYSAEHPAQVQYLLLVGGPDYSSLITDPVESERVKLNFDKMRGSPHKFASFDEARNYLHSSKPYLTGEALDHIMAYNANRDSAGSIEWKYDPAVVSEGQLDIRDDLNAYVKRVQCPILLARAEGNPLFTSERVTQLQPLFPLGQWVTIEKTQVMIQLEQPVALANAIRSFVWERLD